MTGLAGPLFKWGMMDRIQQPLLGRAMRIVTAQAGAAGRLYALVDITETHCRPVVAGKAEFCRLHAKKALGCASMGSVAQAAVLAGRGMGDTILPIFLNILMTGQTEVRFLFHQQLLFPGTMGNMADAAVHCLHRGMDIFAGFNHLAHTLMTGETDLALGLTEQKGIIAGMGGMTGLALPLHKGWVAVLLGLLLASGLVAAETEFALGDGCY